MNRAEWYEVYRYARMNGAPRWLGRGKWGRAGECAWQAALPSTKRGESDPLVRRAASKRAWKSTAPGWLDWRATYAGKRVV